MHVQNKPARSSDLPCLHNPSKIRETFAVTSLNSDVDHNASDTHQWGTPVAGPDLVHDQFSEEPSQLFCVCGCLRIPYRPAGDLKDQASVRYKLKPLKYYLRQLRRGLSTSGKFAGLTAHESFTLLVF